MVIELKVLTQEICCLSLDIRFLLSIIRQRSEEKTNTDKC